MWSPDWNRKVDGLDELREKSGLCNEVIEHIKRLGGNMKAICRRDKNISYTTISNAKVHRLGCLSPKKLKKTIELLEALD